MRALKVYLDTSIPNFLLADDAPQYRQATETLREEILAGRFETYASEDVLAEIDAAPDELAGRFGMPC